MSVRTGFDHERWEDAVGAYLLGALPDDELTGFKAHLETCPACREETDYLRVAAEVLPASPVQYDPPSELKDRIMSVVRAEAQLLQAAGARADLPEGAPESRRRGRLAGLRPGWWSIRPAVGLVAAVTVLAIGIAAGVGLSGGGPKPTPARSVLADVEVPDAEARLIVRERDSTLVAERLPRPGKGRIYQVWFKRRGVEQPVPTDALFGVRHDGSAAVRVPGPLRDVEAIMVTSEPEGGSVAPTRAPIIIATPA